LKKHPRKHVFVRACNIMYFRPAGSNNFVFGRNICDGSKTIKEGNFAAGWDQSNWRTTIAISHKAISTRKV